MSRGFANGATALRPVSESPSMASPYTQPGIARPTLMLEQFFSGEAVGWGVQQTRFGRLKSQFRITAVGTWTESTSTLNMTENYEFDDGHTDILEWDILKVSGGKYVGDEPRIIGQAEGRQRDNWFRWRYRRKVPNKDGSESTYAFDDCFWLQSKHVMIARASVMKLGIEVATMSVFYSRR